MGMQEKARELSRLAREEGPRAAARQLRKWAYVGATLPARRRHSAARLANQRAYPGWLERQQPDAAERARQGERAFSHGLSFLIPTYNTAPELLLALGESLLAQTAPGWEACFYDGASTQEDTRRALRALQARDARLRVELGEENLGIAGNTNRALAMARMDWVALVDHDDLLAPDVAYCILCAAEGGADMAYSDEDKCSADGSCFFDPHLKPDFAPDSLRAGNYVCHIMAMRKSLMEEVGGLRPHYDGSQDHDLALRASERAERIVHIPRVLYHWRMLESSASHQRAEQCADAAARAVDDQLRRLGLPGRAYSSQLRVRIDYDLRPGETVSLVAVCQGRGTQRWLNRLAEATGDQVAETLLVGAGKPCRFQGRDCRAAEGAGSLGARLNAAAAQARGDYVAFVRQGIQPLERDWLSALRMYAQRPDVACAGTALLTRGMIYLHGGYAVDVPAGALSHQAGVSWYNMPYMLTDRLVRNVTAVSAGVMMIRRETLLALGGFPDDGSDLCAVGLGLRARAAGLLNVYVPQAACLWLGGEPPCLTQAPPAEELARFRRDFGEHPPEKYYSPLFEKQRGWMLPDLSRDAPSMD